MKKVAFLLVAIASLSTGVAFGGISKTSAAGGPTVWASFNSPQARGIVEVQNYMSGNGSTVTARIHRPQSGLVGFCLTTQTGALNCQTVNPDLSGFDRTSGGCVTFTISFSETVTDAAITDPSFVNVIARATLTEQQPKNIGMLTGCR